ncbi:UDP-glucose/GDP-mannose dehydrogenase family protein [Paenibacillus sp. FJAT-26967]|uniref:UDP-glucose 6-dehydrogenase TuaD n=1 Tax=Paenibacillus sp. FJAT-26967 TaxID=1729690 RepID=UPI00083988EE|nr:UDP-glucose/GDP-mannose dehydrogenase family protein [Paenibacillus sp. FJAT-26967]
MNKIGVIGTGYVGLVSGTCFAEVGHRVVCCDIDESKINRLQQFNIPIFEPGLEELVKKNAGEGRLSFSSDIAGVIKDSAIIFIAVGTPMSASGEADLSYVKEAARMIGRNMNTHKIIVTKSTVPVGTGRLLESLIRDNLPDSSQTFDVVSNPEFLREGSAIHDCMNMERAVIGASNAQAADTVAELHAPFETTIFKTSLESAEMIKYAANTFLATKISFINAIANICGKVGADVTEVAAGMGLDSRIGNKFLQAGIGYGGSCFPKDTYALKHIAEEAGYSFKLLEAVIETNENQRLLIMDALIQSLGSLQGKKIAVLGLSFKPNTDDVRDSPSLSLIPRMLEMGADVCAYDPIAIREAGKYLPDEVGYAHELYECVTDCDACVILTEWSEVVNMDLERVHRLLRSPVIIDGRNCFELDVMRAHQFEYHSVGRQAIRTAVPAAVTV